jgi:cellulose synthase/poly-beta-1,6-N-acetylglucosamine synthase-like glycosyltransferase
MKSLVSIIIPVKEVNDYLRKETLPALFKQTFRNFEIIILPDKKTKEKFPQTKIIPSWPKTGPADKRDLGAKKSRGKILAFLDDDSYPRKDWLKEAVKVFEEGEEIVGVCGPVLTPPQDNLRQKASGYVWSSWFGSQGAGTYRSAVSARREVDDFPTVNLLVRKKDFFKVGGFNSHFWPGEDTKICLDLVYKLKKKIIYDPRVIVYHHRREVFGPHLKQIARYAIHRGHFARILPQTSLRVGYFMPTLFVLGLFSGFFLSFAHPIFKFVYLATIGVYLTGLLVTASQIYRKEKKLKIALLAILSIFATHFTYGVLFVKGLLSKKLKR